MFGFVMFFFTAQTLFQQLLLAFVTFVEIRHFVLGLLGLNDSFAVVGTQGLEFCSDHRHLGPGPTENDFQRRGI